MTDKANLLCILQLLQNYSDKEHVLTTPDIIKKLEIEYDNLVDRRTVYSSIESLQDLGYPIEKTESKNCNAYYLREREFTTAQLRLLIDAVYNCEYISKKETAELLNKLTGFLSEHQKKNFSYTNIIPPEKKPKDLDVFTNIEKINDAINNKCKISFDYMEYDYDMKLKPKHDKKYIASPYMMICDAGNYYLQATTDVHSNLGNYRIDFMANIVLLQDEKVDSSRRSLGIDSAKKINSAFYGDPVNIRLHGDKSALRYVIEEFGKEIMIAKNRDDSFEAFIKATEKEAIMFALKNIDKVEIVTPQNLREEIKNLIHSNKYDK